MPETQETNTNQPNEGLTAEKISEMITSALTGHAAKYEKQLNKMNESFSGELKKLTTPKTESTAAEGTSTQDPKLAALERTIAELNEKYSAAETKAQKAEQRQALADALSTYQFASDKARDVAFKNFEMDMKRSDDGQYFIGDRDVKTAVAEGLKSLPGLLAPKPVSGSGAVGTQNTQMASFEQKVAAAKTPADFAAIYASNKALIG
jgi:hypothetical protein